MLLYIKICYKEARSMKKKLEQYFGCEVRVTDCKNTLALPIFMTMRDIKLVKFYGVSFALINIIKEPELTIAAMKKQQKKYEEALQCPIAYEMALNSVNMRNALWQTELLLERVPT